MKLLNACSTLFDIDKDLELKGFVFEPATAQKTVYELKGTFLVVQGDSGHYILVSTFFFSGDPPNEFFFFRFAPRPTPDD